MKKTRILEHNNFVQVKLREEAEAKATNVYSSLQRERAQRLRDMHVCQQLKKDKQDIEKCEKEQSKKLKRQYQISKSLISQVKGLHVAIKSHQDFLDEQEVDFQQQEDSLATYQIQNNRLKLELAKARDVSKHHEKVRELLEQECQKLRTKLIQGSKKKLKESIETVHEIPSLAVERFLGQSPSSQIKASYRAYQRQLPGTEVAEVAEVDPIDSSEISLTQLAKYMSKVIPDIPDRT